MRNRDDYRSMYDVDILDLARSDGIDPEMAVVLAERLELTTTSWGPASSESMGGRYTFNNRSE